MSDASNTTHSEARRAVIGTLVLFSIFGSLFYTVLFNEILKASVPLKDYYDSVFNLPLELFFLLFGLPGIIGGVALLLTIVDMVQNQSRPQRFRWLFALAVLNILTVHIYWTIVLRRLLKSPSS